MHLVAHEMPTLNCEYQALLRHYGQTQARCDALLRSQADDIARLQGQAMRLRAAVIVRDTALAWERAQRAQDLHLAMQRLAHERLRWLGRRPAHEIAGQEASQEATDLVICQTGCLSHGAYWLDQNQCRRTGKNCVLVEAPEAAGSRCDPLPPPAPAWALADNSPP